MPQVTVDPSKVNVAALGIDVIASLSIGLYTEPLDVYRELVQNAVDAYAQNSTLNKQGRINIIIDKGNRKISVTDYAAGLSESEFSSRLLSIGNSDKLQKNLRGFRGIGRLATLGYCKRVRFRTRQASDEPILEATWDSVKLRHEITNNGSESGLDFISRITQFSSYSTDDDSPKCFF